AFSCSARAPHAAKRRDSKDYGRGRAMRRAMVDNVLVPRCKPLKQRSLTHEAFKIKVETPDHLFLLSRQNDMFQRAETFLNPRTVCYVLIQKKAESIQLVIIVREFLPLFNHLDWRVGRLRFA